jgi:hypothetical protein
MPGRARASAGPGGPFGWAEAKKRQKNGLKRKKNWIDKFEKKRRIIQRRRKQANMYSMKKVEVLHKTHEHKGEACGLLYKDVKNINYLVLVFKVA